MGENLYNKAHRASTPAYRKGYDATFRKEKDMKQTYGQQVVEILDSLFGRKDWETRFWDIANGEEHTLSREELLAQPDLLTARKYIKGKEEA